jgi:hypothetical protein
MLSDQGFLKFVKDTDAMDNVLSLARVDAVMRQTMVDVGDFSRFCDATQRLAVMKFPREGLPRFMARASTCGPGRCRPLTGRAQSECVLPNCCRPHIDVMADELLAEDVMDVLAAHRDALAKVLARARWLVSLGADWVVACSCS